MEARQHRALHIAATNRLVVSPDGRWKVPSQTGTGAYTVVSTSDGSWICTCPDYEERLDWCKHIWAVRITCDRETDSKDVPYSEVPKVTYTQDWKAYNAAQCDEKAMFLNLLSDLCANVAQPAQEGRGQRVLPMADMMFLNVFRTYARLSARRYDTDVRDLADRGYVDCSPSFNSVLRYLAREDVTTILTNLVELSALPLAAIETDFAVDSSGFGTPNLRSWYSTKHGRVIESRVWRKAHLMCGVQTNIVTAVEVSGPDSNDSPYLPELARTTAKKFTLRDVSADKGYLSKSNADAIEQLGATPFIAWKSNNVEPPEGSAWARMWHMFAYHRDEYLTRYHARSNVETTFSMIKRKFGDTLRGKTATAQDNEVLCKVLAHNLCCLVHAHYELGITPDLTTGTTPPGEPVEPARERHLRIMK